MTQKLVIDYLAGCGGAKAQEIASAIGKDRHEVNRVLYSLQATGQAHVSPEYIWTYVSAKPPAAPFGPWTPTDEQRRVVKAAPEERLFVEAGPGTGKTDTLVARLEHLTRASGLSATNVLVLSFSVAAIRELKSRIARHHNTSGAVAFVEIRTFDSFASRFLRTVILQGELSELDYDERIERATAELAKDGPLPPFIADYRHVLLDEMQDLVGVRADFARQLLARLKPGFTLFGDSAQGIYDFQLESGASRTTSSDLVLRISADFPDLRTGLRFTRSFRFGGNPRLEKIGLTGRTLLLESPAKAGAFLEQEFAALACQGSTQDPEIDSKLMTASTCVVCRTNGQVLRLAAKLHSTGIPFRIARDQNEYVVPPWLGVVFFAWGEEKIRKQVFVPRVRSLFSLTDEEALMLWRALATVVIGKPAEVAFSAADLRAAVTDRTILPDHPLAAPSDAIQLSTIHRAKGREFENVIVVMRQDDDEEDADDGEDAIQPSAEHRVMFVALTRARSVLCRMEAATRGVKMRDARWIRVYFSKGFKMLNAFQAGLPRDVDPASFVRGTVAEAEARQKHLLALRPGMSVELKFVGREHGCPRYAIEAGGQPLGMMSKEFGWALWRTIKDLNKFRTVKKLPHRILNLWVREITTMTSDLADDTIDRSLRHCGLWLGLELEGMGYCNEWAP